MNVQQNDTGLNFTRSRKCLATRRGHSCYFEIIGLPKKSTETFAENRVIINDEYPGPLDVCWRRHGGIPPFLVSRDTKAFRRSGPFTGHIL